MQPFDARSFLRHGVITAAFSCAIALALTVSGQGAWDVQLVYSLSIGLVAWAVIDLGRLPLVAPEGRGWPTGWRGLLLVVAGMACGYVVGTLLGNAYSGQAEPLWQRRGVSTSLVITVLSGASISYFFHSLGKARYLQLQMARAQRDAAQAQLQLLAAQLEPHMLFNTLANLRVLIEIDPPRAQAMLDHLIAFLRATLGGARTTLHPLADELARVRDYLELMAVRMGARLTFTLDLPADLASLPVPTLVLQPLVENAVLHGLDPLPGGGHITVSAQRQGPHLLLEVRDNGRGLPAGAPQGATGDHGFGLAQIRERLQVLYGTQGTLVLHSLEPGGTLARIQLPIDPSE